jgi:dipeptidyl aminopeptidase/acylaminoacyl peptidase
MSDAIVEDVGAALDAAIRTTVVDSARLGLHGHSFGGYAASVLVARLPRFKAAIASAAPIDWLRKYSEIRVTGLPDSFLAESGSQPYIPQPWWDNWEASYVNSPLFDAPRVSTPLLLIHGRQDKTVRFGHSEQFFNVLRRMGDKAVVLLEYPDEEHVLASPASVRDATLRQLQFYDHFLKGEPAPEWWASGLPTQR